MDTPSAAFHDGAKAGSRRRDDAAGDVDQLCCRRHGLSPSLVFRWRRLMTEGGQEAVRADDEVVLAADVRRREERVRELERLRQAPQSSPMANTLSKHLRSLPGLPVNGQTQPTPSHHGAKHLVEVSKPNVIVRSYI
jgi:transposase-like protein